MGWRGEGRRSLLLVRRLPFGSCEIFSRCTTSSMSALWYIKTVSPASRLDHDVCPRQVHPRHLLSTASLPVRFPPPYASSPQCQSQRHRCRPPRLSRHNTRPRPPPIRPRRLFLQHLSHQRHRHRRLLAPRLSHLSLYPYPLLPFPTQITPHRTRHLQPPPQRRQPRPVRRPRRRRHPHFWTTIPSQHPGLHPRPSCPGFVETWVHREYPRRGRRGRRRDRRRPQHLDIAHHGRIIRLEV